MAHGWEDTEFEDLGSEDEGFGSETEETPKRSKTQIKQYPQVEMKSKEGQDQSKAEGKHLWTHVPTDVVSHFSPWLAPHELAKYLQTSKAGKESAENQSKHCRNECKKAFSTKNPLSILESTKCAGFCMYHHCSEILSLLIALLTLAHWTVHNPADPSGHPTSMSLKKVILTITPHKKEPTVYEVSPGDDIEYVKDHLLPTVCSHLKMLIRDHREPAMITFGIKTKKRVPNMFVKDYRLMAGEHDFKHWTFDKAKGDLWTKQVLLTPLILQ